jgi:hypothetical protein
LVQLLGAGQILNVQWLTIYSTFNNGGMNAGGTANLTYVSYDGGSNPDLKAFKDGGVVTATYQFTGLNLPEGEYANLTYLSTNAVQTSYSGSMSPIPIPPSALLLGTGLLGLVGLGYRRKRKS